MRAAGVAPAWSRPPVLGRTSGVGVWSGNGRLEQGPHSGSRVCRRLERKPHAGLGAWARGIGDVWSGRPTQGQECEDVWSGSPIQQAPWKDSMQAPPLQAKNVRTSTTEGPKACTRYARGRHGPLRGPALSCWTRRPGWESGVGTSGAEAPLRARSVCQRPKGFLEREPHSGPGV